MIQLVLAKEVLNKIIYEDVTFKKALKDISKSKENQPYLKVVSALVGCELRHHLLFTHLLKPAIETYSQNQFIFSCLAFANRFFLKALNDELVKVFLNEQLATVDHKLFDEIYAFDGSPIDLIKLPRESIDFTSIRFNTPRWLIKMWSKHFSKGQTYKILKKINRPFHQFVAVNTLLTNSDELISKYPEDFEKTDFENLLSIKSKINPKKLPEYKIGYFYLLKKPLREIIEANHNELLKEISVYSGSNSEFIRDLVVKSKLEDGINLAVPSIENRPELLRLIRTSKARNINLFEVKDETSLKAGLSEKQELFYVFPESSSFDKISLYPDYLIHFKRERLDEIIEGERRALELVSPYIIEDGKLIYLVDTLNKKESSLLIQSFIADHPEFELVKEKQYFPYDESEMALYCAVIRRKVISND